MSDLVFTVSDVIFIGITALLGGFAFGFRLASWIFERSFHE